MSSELIVSIGLLVFMFGLYKVFQPTRSRKKAAKLATAAMQPPVTKLVITSSDISAIAGDDVMSTQLDLARAYVETGRFTLAKKILDHVREHGSSFQQQEAQQLLNNI